MATSDKSHKTEHYGAESGESSGKWFAKKDQPYTGTGRSTTGTTDTRKLKVTEKTADQK